MSPSLTAATTNKISLPLPPCAAAAATMSKCFTQYLVHVTYYQLIRHSKVARVHVVGRLDAQRASYEAALRGRDVALQALRDDTVARLEEARALSAGLHAQLRQKQDESEKHCTRAGEQVALLGAPGQGPRLSSCRTPENAWGCREQAMPSGVRQPVGSRPRNGSTGRRLPLKYLERGLVPVHRIVFGQCSRCSLA